MSVVKVGGSKGGRHRVGQKDRDQILENVMLMNLDVNFKATVKPLKHVKQETGMTGFIMFKDHNDSCVEDCLERL